VVDMITDAMEGRVVCHFCPVTITAGHEVTLSEAGEYRVPKKELVVEVRVQPQTRRLRIAQALPEAAILAKELETFQVKITATANVRRLERGAVRRPRPRGRPGGVGRRTPVLLPHSRPSGGTPKTCSANNLWGIGLTGFEPATSWSRSSQSATRHIGTHPGCVPTPYSVDILFARRCGRTRPAVRRSGTWALKTVQSGTTKPAAFGVRSGLRHASSIDREPPHVLPVPCVPTPKFVFFCTVLIWRMRFWLGVSRPNGSGYFDY
jgi:hypothetical protein